MSVSSSIAEDIGRSIALYNDSQRSPKKHAVEQTQWFDIHWPPLRHERLILFEQETIEMIEKECNQFQMRINTQKEIGQISCWFCFL